MTDNIIIFPVEKSLTPPQSKEEVISNVVETRKEYALGITEVLYYLIVDKLYSDGVRFQPEVAPNLLMLYNCIESLCFRSLHLSHPFNELTDTTMQVEDAQAVVDDLYEMINGYSD